MSLHYHGFFFVQHLCILNFQHMPHTIYTKKGHWVVHKYMNWDAPSDFSPPPQGTAQDVDSFL